MRSELTESEQLFQRFCDEHSIPCQRIPPDDDPTPDYAISIRDTRVFVEIKELTLNEDEQEALRDFETSGETSWGGTVGNRIRKEIERARHQLKRHAAGGHPGVLLIYDARPFPFRGISEYGIRVAMYGSEAIDLHVPKEIGEPIQWGAHRFGKGKKLRHDTHTYISAIGVLRPTKTEGQYHIDLYDNIHAMNPLPWEALAHMKDISLFTLAAGNSNEFREWARMVTPDQYRKQNPGTSAVE